MHFILSMAMFVLGLVMIIIPDRCTKEEFRENPDMVKKTRRSGIILMCCGLVLWLLFFLLSQI